ncbi:MULTISPECIES: amidohydrolase family protein [Thiomicrorhabdus]|uniref:Amidohydrolase family protein n=1 Tax=Thiomicrorhabdus heinhorstiae TaxID=2748010 RepID=A0ABS0BZI9_9GAMM|nr:MULTISPECIES: amidohydrolase family protein [Thiomicrorhabdus]MBF6057406.1 amidohydrolase family protein [Thiomicrorhabdus heinhorstiae]
MSKRYRCSQRISHLLLGCTLSVITCQAHAQDSKTLPLIDAHSHYAQADTEAFNPQEIIGILDTNRVEKILITSTPNQGTIKLYDYAPNRVIPFLSVYRTKADKPDWMHRGAVVAEAEEALKTGKFKGIGELHIFAKDRKSPVLKGLVELAKANRLPMLIHGDAEIIDEIFQIDPSAQILWAHLGTKPEITLLSSMLQRYPQNLYIDTSVRDKQLLAEGVLAKKWKAFLIDHQDRLMAAIDTFSVNRWKTYDLVVKDIQTWLADLPPEVARKIARGNAERFFGLKEDI